MASYEEKPKASNAGENVSAYQYRPGYSSTSNAFYDNQHERHTSQMIQRHGSTSLQQSQSWEQQPLDQPPSYDYATASYPTQIYDNSANSQHLSQQPLSPPLPNPYLAPQFPPPLQHTQSAPPHPCQTPSSISTVTFKPIAIPATTTALDSAFLRAFPQSLAPYHISRSTFLTFLDTLNRIAIASPPLQALSLAGNIIGIVPEPISQTVGTALSMGSEAGAGILAKGRTELALRDANRTIFRPRGLKVEIAKTEVVAKLVGWRVFNEDGKLDKGVALLPPVASGGVVSAQQRRLKALEGWIAELDVEELPELAVPNNLVSKVSAKASERSRRKGEERLMRKRKEAEDEYVEERGELDKEFQEELERLDSKIEKARAKCDERGDSKYEREIRSREKERAELVEEYEKKFKRMDRERTKEDEEEKNMRKLLWLLIRRVDE